MGLCWTSGTTHSDSCFRHRHHLICLAGDAAAREGGAAPTRTCGVAGLTAECAPLRL